MEDDKLISNITKDLNLGKSKKSSKSEANQQFVYLDKTRMEEGENNIPASSSMQSDVNNKMSFTDVLKNFDLPSILNETQQTKLKKTIKNFVKNKDTSKVEIKFDDTEGKVIERSKNYDSLSKEVTKYQPKVKVNREADVLDFTTNNQNLSFTAKSLINNSSKKDMNNLEKSIQEILTKNKYDTEEKIIEEENKKLMSVNPEEVKQRYEELKRVKGLLFQQELKNKRQSKIKSKLYHKIKNKQKEREEKILLEQLEEVDGDAVRDYLEKKKMQRIKERIELKHSFNSKFNKTVKRYNLHKDDNVKEAIKENFKLRDELLKKIKGQEDDDEGQDSFEDEDEMDYEQDEADNQSENENQKDEPEEEIDEEKLLINFNENQSDQEEDESKDKPNGVWAMKFMKNADLQSKLKDVLHEIDSEEEFNYDSDDSENIRPKGKNANFNKFKKQKVESDNESEEEQNLSKLKGKNLLTNARRKNVIEHEEDDGRKSKSMKNNKSSVETTQKTITAQTLNELNDDAKQMIRPEDSKVDLNAEDIKRLVQMEEINEDEEMFNKFLVQNDDNKKEFLEESKPKVQENTKILSGWGSWAGDTKVLNAKEFLRKKRQQEYEKRKQSQVSENPSHVKVNNTFDKKFSNYMVKELPNNVRSQEQFEKLNGTGVGREWNSLTMYKKLIQPNVVKKIGQIIEPMRINDNTTAKKLCDIIEKATKKKQRTKAKI
jgi:U3 small nucleolar RNA-associated protein 14